MSRGLRPVFFVLFLASAIAASAGPDDLFDARIPGALQPGQQEVLLALESGRYTLKEGRFLDARAPDPGRPQLTNARVAELLAARGTNLPPLPAAAIPTDVRPNIALPSAAKTSPGLLNFDGGVAHGGDIRGPPASGSVASGKSAPGVLQTQLLQRLVFKGSKQEREALGEAVGTILQTRTGRELAAAFVRERAVAGVSIGAIDNSSVVTEHGKKILSGTSGMTETDKIPPEVTISRAYMGTDPAFRRVVMAGTLAHELFGHALEAQRAKRAGFPKSAQDHYRGDEIGSRLIDWLIQTELTGKVDDASPAEYLTDPEGYHRGLVTVDPYYVNTLSAKEMKNPVTTLRGRRKMVAADEAKTTAGIKDMEDWRPIIAHFVKVHRIAKARFAPAEEELNTYLVWAYGHQKKIAEIKESLEGMIEYWSTPKGAKEKKQVIDAASDPYLLGMEASLTARARELRRLRAGPPQGRGPSSTAVLVMPELVITGSKTPDLIGLDELSEMHALDREKNPGHWK